MQNANTAAPTGRPEFIGWCLDKEDLCVAKLCAFREKDRNFVAALVRADLVDTSVISTRLQAVASAHLPAAVQARAWLEAQGSH